MVIVVVVNFSLFGCGGGAVVSWRWWFAYCGVDAAVLTQNFFIDNSCAYSHINVHNSKII